MNLSNILFSTLFKKLKLAPLNEEKFYLESLIKRISLLKKEKEFKLSIWPKWKKNDHDLFIHYLINISFLKTNTTVSVANTKGNIKLFCTAGYVGLVGKQKRKRRMAISKLIALVLQKAVFLRKTPVALHLTNVRSYRRLIIKKFKRNFYIRIIKSFNQASYNGCRKKKLRRKKYTKKFK